MKTIILAAGQGTRLRPLTDDCPKCMVEINGSMIIDRQLAVMRKCGILEEDITIVTGYCGEKLKHHLRDTRIRFVQNEAFETTNMVCSLMCAEPTMKEAEDILISYGDIVYREEVLKKALDTAESAGVIVDDDWLSYWSKRCEDPLDDAETLVIDQNDCLVEIGQKTRDIERVQSQYIGLMRFRGKGLTDLLFLAEEAKRRSERGEKLWRTERTYEKMYMTDLLQGMIDTGKKLKALHISRGWYEVDDPSDLALAEKELR